jgi:hypothetical protein
MYVQFNAYRCCYAFKKKTICIWYSVKSIYIISSVWRTNWEEGVSDIADGPGIQMPLFLTKTKGGYSWFQFFNQFQLSFYIQVDPFSFLSMVY